MCPIDSLPPKSQQRLMKILEEYLEAMEQGLAPEADQLVAQHPDLAEPLRAYLASLDFLHQAAIGFGPGGRTPTATAEVAEGRLGDYRIVREIGRGGMGVVYEARQVSLDRQVALKVLPFAAVLDKKQIARFRNEAQAAAQLHHPNIVPVFSVGCERGVHYYAMQYVEGQPLDLAIRQLRQLADMETGHAEAATEKTAATPAGSGGQFADRRGQRPGEGSTCRAFSTTHSIKSKDYIRTVAGLGIQAAEALQHAHEYGIIHRDVKPSNLLLDDAGKLWVADFGLARFQVAGGQAHLGLTTTGDVMGTIRYMSPEQAAGRSALIDQRTDVYSLGITLYELLTLREAFEGADRQELLRRVAEEEPYPPRRINPSIPVDLETIVLKAISKSPPQRYATAGALADDLRHFLEGEPVLARRPTMADRAGKWARRHKTAVVTAAALMVTAVVGLLVATMLIAREHAHTKAALAQAEANYRQARGVVDRFGARLAEQLANVPGAEQLRRELLSDTLNYYQDFIQHAGDDPTLRADLAITYFKAGTITEQIGDREKALAAYRRAKRVFEQLVQQRPDDQKHRSDLALCHNNIGLVLSLTGKTAEAEQAYQKAIEIQKRLIQDHPDTAKFRSHLALSLSNLGLLQSQTNQTTRAEQSYQSAIGSQKELVDRYPEEAKYLSDLAISYSNLGFLYSKTEPAKAEGCCREALTIQQKLVRSHPNDVRYSSDLALSYNSLGALESHQGRRGDSEESYQSAIDIQKQLVRKAPSVLRFRRDLAISYNNLGRLYSRSQDPARADESFQKARAIVEDLVRDYPNELSYRSSLGGILNNLGMVLEQLDRREEAAVMYRQAIEHQRFALEHAPKVARFREFLSKHYWNYGQVLRALDRPAEAAQLALARKQLWPGSPQRLYRVAEELALAAGKVGEGRSELSAEEASAKRQCADQAVATLREAIDAGFDRPEEIRRDPDLDSIRGHPGFGKLLQTPTKPKKVGKVL